METWQKTQSSLNSTFKLTPEHYMVWLWELHLRQGLIRGGQHEDFLSFSINFGTTFSYLPVFCAPPHCLVIAIWFIEQSLYMFSLMRKDNLRVFISPFYFKIFIVVVVISWHWGKGMKAYDWRIPVGCWAGFSAGLVGKWLRPLSPDAPTTLSLKSFGYCSEYSQNEACVPLSVETSWAPGIRTALSLVCPNIF